MDFSIIKASDFKTTKWSGGTTKQLYISPSAAEYQSRNFDFRLSSAKVEVEKSDFTLLPGVSRKLMILDSEMTINHQNHYSKTLHKFDYDEFEGDWKTSSIGKCTDFNLMTRNNTFGELNAAVIKKHKNLEFLTNSVWDFLFVYLFSGKIDFVFHMKKRLLSQGDLLVLNNLEDAVLLFFAHKNSELIFTIIGR